MVPPALGKKTRVLRNNSRSCYQNCWHIDLVLTEQAIRPTCNWVVWSTLIVFNPRRLNSYSRGVTRVGDTRGGNWRYHPYFSLQKLTTFFGHHCRFYSFYSGFTPWRVSPRTFLPVRPRWSTILCKFSHKKFLSFGCHPLEGVTRGDPSHSSDATGLQLGRNSLSKDLGFYDIKHDGMIDWLIRWLMRYLIANHRILWRNISG